MPPGILSHRRGFVLVAVLWIVVTIGGIAIAAVGQARATSALLENRTLLEEAKWKGIGCVNQARALLESHLRAGDSPSAERAVWQTLSAVIGPHLRTQIKGCQMEMEASGTRINVNGADTESLLRYFEGAESGSSRHDLIDALRDWIDSDTLPRPLGAERAWYRSQGAIPPRNAPLQDRRELRLVRGFSSLDPAMLSGLDVDPELVTLTAADPIVLRALPGIGPDLARALHEHRMRGDPISDLRDLERIAGPVDAEAFRAHYPTLAAVAAIDPAAWFIRARVQAGVPPVSRRVQARVVRDGHRTTITAWRIE